MKFGTRGQLPNENYSIKGSLQQVHPRYYSKHKVSWLGTVDTHATNYEIGQQSENNIYIGTKKNLTTT